MEELNLRYKTLLKAYSSLQNIIKKLQNQQRVSEELREIYRDSLIKRFEFSYDLTWKYLKYFLEENYGIVVNSSKTVFRECLGQKIINEEELKLLLKMVDDRSVTSHIYNESFAQEISERIIVYFNFLHEFVRAIKPKKIKESS